VPSRTVLRPAGEGEKMRDILGVPVYGLTFDKAKDILDERFEYGQNEIIAFANANSINIAASNSEYRNVLQRSFTLNDGVGVNIASMIIFGKKFPENLNGTDFVPRYLRSTKHCFRIFLLGAKAGVAKRAAKTLMGIAPQHLIVGEHHGYVNEADACRVIENIRQRRADIILVAMGNPLQELWLSKNLTATGCRLGFAVGALFDFLSEDVPRAPLWVRRMYLEWMFRLLVDPRRLGRRYTLGSLMFLSRIFARRLRIWFSPHQRGASEYHDAPKRKKSL
jgi:alpha-1,3-mannosyltransferase